MTDALELISGAHNFYQQLFGLLMATLYNMTRMKGLQNESQFC